MPEHPLRQERLSLGVLLQTVAALSGLHDSFLCKAEKSILKFSRDQEKRVRSVLLRLRAAVEKSPLPIDFRDVAALRRYLDSQDTNN